jgi:hypothetical protein
MFGAYLPLEGVREVTDGLPRGHPGMRDETPVTRSGVVTYGEEDT